MKNVFFYIIFYGFSPEPLIAFKTTGWHFPFPVSLVFIETNSMLTDHFPSPESVHNNNNTALQCAPKGKNGRENYARKCRENGKIHNSRGNYDKVNAMFSAKCSFQKRSERDVCAKEEVLWWKTCENMRILFSSHPIFFRGNWIVLWEGNRRRFFQNYSFNFFGNNRQDIDSEE